MQQENTGLNSGTIASLEYNRFIRANMTRMGLELEFDARLAGCYVKALRLALVKLESHEAGETEKRGLVSLCVKSLQVCGDGGGVIGAFTVFAHRRLLYRLSCDILTLSCTLSRRRRLNTLCHTTQFSASALARRYGRLYKKLCSVLNTPYAYTLYIKWHSKPPRRSNLPTWPPSRRAWWPRGWWMLLLARFRSIVPKSTPRASQPS